MTETAPFHRYLELAPESDCVKILRTQFEGQFPRFELISEEKASVVHAPFTWTIKQVVGHLSDTERVFSYRALRFSRGDKTPLAGFDQDAYIQMANFSERAYHEIVQELCLVRRATIEMFRAFPKEAMDQTGVASGFRWSVRDLGRCMVGHVRHHLQIIEQRVSGD